MEKKNKQELSSLFLTYGLGVMARTRIGNAVRTYGTDRGNTKCPSAILPIGGGINKTNTSLMCKRYDMIQQNCTNCEKIQQGNI